MADLPMVAPMPVRAFNARVDALAELASLSPNLRTSALMFAEELKQAYAFVQGGDMDNPTARETSDGERAHPPRRATIREAGQALFDFVEELDNADLLPDQLRSEAESILTDWKEATLDD